VWEGGQTREPLLIWKGETANEFGEVGGKMSQRGGDTAEAGGKVTKESKDSQKKETFGVAIINTRGTSVKIVVGRRERRCGGGQSASKQKKDLRHR